jgi:hypothetical protein
MTFTRHEILQGDIEKRIITGLIVDNKFCRDAIPILRLKYFQIDYARRVVQWIDEYYKKYKKAPGKDIQAIFQAEEKTMKAAEAGIVEEFLKELSTQYEQKEVFNSEYLLDQTYKYAEARSYEILKEQIEGGLLQGKLDKVSDAIRGFNKVAKETSRWVNPFDKKEVDKTLDDDSSDNLFKLPGALGDLIGTLKREWLIAVMGPMKRGKSFYAWEIAYHGLIARLKVVVFSLEMNSTQFKKRIYKRMTAMAEYGGEYDYPVFDCLHNQDGACLSEKRQNRRTLISEDGTLPEYTPNSKYKPCDWCRRNKSPDYALSWWWKTQKQKQDLSTEAIAKKVKTFKQLYGNNLRLMCHPPFSATFDDLISDLDNLEYTENFIPDIILIDYFDITAKTNDDERADANIKWQRGKNLAGVRRALVINCNQSNRDSIDRKNIGQKNTGEDIRKLAHVDALFVLNQLPSEKKEGRIRIDTLVHRHDEASEKGQVIVLQQLKLGQPFLDSEWESKRKRKKKEEE